MNEEYRSSSSSTRHQSDLTTSAFIPLVLLAVSLVAIFIWQISNLSSQRTGLNEIKVRMETAFQQSTPQHQQLIDQSRLVQAKLEAIVRDVLTLAKDGDADAKAIIEKYGIREQQAAGGAAPAPAPAPETKPPEKK